MRTRRLQRLLLAGIACWAALASVAAQAVDVAIANPSFEDDVVPNPTGIVSGVPNGWLAYGDGAVAVAFYGSLHAAPTNYPLGAPDGTNVAINYVGAGGTSAVAFDIRQVVAATLEADTLYTLEVEVANIDSGFNDLPNTPMDFSDDSFFDIRGYNGYRIELRVDDGGADVPLEPDLDSPPAIPDGAFQTRTLTFDSTGVAPGLVGLPLEIRLVNRNLVDPAFPASDRETGFDDVRLSAVPAAASEQVEFRHDDGGDLLLAGRGHEPVQGRPLVFAAGHVAVHELLGFLATPLYVGPQNVELGLRPPAPACSVWGTSPARASRCPR